MNPFNESFKILKVSLMIMIINKNFCSNINNYVNPSKSTKLQYYRLNAYKVCTILMVTTRIVFLQPGARRP